MIAMRATLGVLALAAALVVPLSAHAEEAATIGAVLVGGGAGDHDRGVVSAAIAAAATAAGWSLPGAQIATQDIDRLFECGEPGAPWACVPAAIGGRRIFAFAVERNQATNGAPIVVLTGRLISSAPRALVVRQRFCEHCADDRLGEAASELARQLLQDLAVRTGRTILEVASTPPGARITLDGQPIGATNATFNTFPGPHRVVVEKRGYTAATRSVVAEEGKTAAIAVELLPSSPPPPVRARRALAGALIGGGALAAVSAGLLLELGARGGAEHPDDKYRYAGATPVGAVLGIAGAAAVTGGIVLWWRAPGLAGASAAVGTAGSDRRIVADEARAWGAGWLAAF